MNLTAQWMQSEWIRALGWTFVHSLWQIAITGLLLYIILRLIPGRSAHTRYAISTLALWSIVVMSLSTFIIMLPDTRQVTEISGKVVMIHATESPGITGKISAWLEVRMPMMLTIWFGGVTILLLRLAVSLGWVKHIRTTAQPEAGIQQSLDQIIQRLRLRIKPIASESSLVPSPVTIGHLKPLILFPMGIINQLSPQEVEAILTHELAHIVRRDYLSNLIQSFIETLFYYHPVTWWISGMVRTERENRADDLAVSWCGDHLGYAKSLMTVQEMQAQTNPSLAIGFASRKGAMLARIQRILNIPYKNHNQMEKTVLLSLCSLCFLAFTMTSPNSDNQQKKTDPSSPALFSYLEEKTDSIPATGTYRIHKKTDDQDISIEVEDGDVKELKIDGKEIEPSEFETYGQVIEDLFGGIESSPSFEEFAFTMPPIPAIPAIPAMPAIPGMPELSQMMEGFYFELPDMPPIPDIPPMPEIELEKFLDGSHFNWSGDGSDITIWNGDEMENMKIMMDSTPDGSTKIIIINNGDSSIICTPHFGWAAETPMYFGSGENWLSEEDWKKHEEAWKEQAEQWRRQAEQWKEQWHQNSEQWRAGQEQQLRELERISPHWDEDHQRAMERELSHQDEMLRMYDMRTPRLSLSDEMVKDGLVDPGDEVEVQLTPDKLKINGEKMPEAIHQKYLRMYEQQQGVELSGNSRVEFITKSKQRM